MLMANGSEVMKKARKKPAAFGENLTHICERYSRDNLESDVKIRVSSYLSPIERINKKSSLLK